MYPGKRRSKSRGSSADRLWLAGLVVASLALLVLSRGDAVISRFIINNASDMTAPLLQGLSEPIGQMRSAVSNAGSYAFMVEEVTRLRRENDRLRALQGKVEELGDRVRRYEELLNSTKPAPTNFVTAQVIGDTGSPFVRTALIGTGRNSGIAKDQPVVSSRGLVGRTISAGRTAARVLLLTDLNSRVPVRVQPDGYRAVLAGNNSDRPTLEFLPLGARLQAGDRIVTSGHGGLFPPGLPVGTIEVDPDGRLQVALAAVAEYLDYVRVLEPAPVGSPDEPALSPEGAPISEAPVETPSQEPAGAETAAAAPDNARATAIPSGNAAGGSGQRPRAQQSRQPRAALNAAPREPQPQPQPEPEPAQAGTGALRSIVPASPEDQGFGP
jgi:rod shape-determining protein MreC